MKYYEQMFDRLLQDQKRVIDRKMMSQTTGQSLRWVQNHHLGRRQGCTDVLLKPFTALSIVAARKYDEQKIEATS